MSFLALIKKGGLAKVATATHATDATLLPFPAQKAPTVAGVATIAAASPCVDVSGADAGATLGVGASVSWQSPLFGRCHGRIAIAHDEYEWMLVADHSATKDFAFISKNWDVRVIDSPD